MNSNNQSSNENTASNAFHLQQIQQGQFNDNIKSNPQMNNFPQESAFQQQKQMYYNNATPTRNLHSNEQPINPMNHGQNMQNKIPQLTPYPPIQSMQTATPSHMYINNPIQSQAFSQQQQQKQQQQQFHMMPQMNPNSINPNMLSFNQAQYQQPPVSNLNNQTSHQSFHDKQKGKFPSKTPIISSSHRGSNSSFVGNSEPVTQYKSRRRKRPNTSKIDPAELEESLPIGDEFDKYNSRDIAIARYQRYHDYIATIFSPLPTDSKTKSDFYSSMDKNILQDKIKRLESELESIKSKHLSTKESFEKNSKLYSDLINDLKPSNVNKLDETKSKLLSLFNIESFEDLKKIYNKIPVDLEEENVPEKKLLSL
ncbi:hypothetical protein AYI69_g3215 [Smittium culicis]|uniref:Uncharacterized protein n=1 Tax=Smittium culicis TaxID=133412 RepID=A0A1R1YKU6_9FUNG|nr:hypothetical protein AYI69_g3215 [Smittium culicis]